jgi:hypothetical protein
MDTGLISMVSMVIGPAELEQMSELGTSIVGATTKIDFRVEDLSLLELLRALALPRSAGDSTP